jgi:hypothetical protein
MYLGKIFESGKECFNRRIGRGHTQHITRGLIPIIIRILVYYYYYYHHHHHHQYYCCCYCCERVVAKIKAPTECPSFISKNLMLLALG